MTMPDLQANARLNTQEWEQGIGRMKKTLADLQKQSATVKLSAQLAGGDTSLKAVTALRAVVEASNQPMTAMQQQIAAMFGEYEVGSKRAAASAEAFKAQQDAVRAKIQELDRAVKITRAQFQEGLGEASDEEVAKLTAEMNRLQGELKEVGAVAKREFGEYSREMQQVANANRLASTTAQAAAGQITRLGLASQVKLGVSGALQGYGGQAQAAGVNLFQFAQNADKARIAGGLFEKTVEKMGGSSTKADAAVVKLTDTLGVSADAARESIRGLLRQGYTLEQAVTALTGAGASALAAGKDAQYGMQAYVEASTSMSSAMLNEIGISENLSTFYQKYAKSLGKTVDGLTKQEKAQAEVNLIMAATGDEVGDLEAILGGLGGNMNSVSREFTEAGKALGETLIPMVTEGMKVVTEGLETFNSWSDGTKAAAAGAAAIGVGTLAVAGPISSLVELVKGLVEGYQSLKGASPATALQETAEAAEESGSLIDDAASSIEDAQGKWDTFTGAFDTIKGHVTGANTSWANYRTSVLTATGANNLWSVSAWKMIGTNLVTWVKTTTAAWAAQAVAMAPNIALLGAAAAATLGLTAAAVSYNKTIQNMADNEEWEANATARFESTMKQVQALTKEGTAYSRGQAKLLLLEEQLAAAKEGEIVSVDYWGKITRKVNEEQVAALEEQIEGQTEKNKVLAEEERKRRVLLGLAIEITEEEQRAREEALKGLDKTLKDRQFSLKLEGMSELDAEVARVQKEFDDLREQIKKPFYINGALHKTPELEAALKELDAQAEAEKAAVRERARMEAAASAAEIAAATQRAEIEAMQEGAAKKRALRELDIKELEADLAEQAEALAEFPELQAQAIADGQRQVAALRRQNANEDAEEARKAAEERAEEERKAEERRIEQAKRVEGLVADARREARDAEIAAIQGEGDRASAERQAQLDDERQATQDRLAEVERGSAAYYAILDAGNRKTAAMQAKWAAEDEAQVRETARRIARAWADAAAAQGEARMAALEAQQARFELDLARQIAQAGEGTVEAARLEEQAIARRFQLQVDAAEQAHAVQRRNLELQYREAVSAENLTADERQAIYQRFMAQREQLDSEYVAGALERVAQQEEAERQAAEAILEARKKAAQEPIRDAERQAQRLSSAQALVRTDAEYADLQRRIGANLEQQLQAQRNLLAQADSLGLTAEEREGVEDAIYGLQTQQVQLQREQEERARRLRDLAQQRRDAELAYNLAAARTDAEQVAALRAQLTEARRRRDAAGGEMVGAGTEEKRAEAAQRYYQLQEQILGLEGQIADVSLGRIQEQLTLRESERRLMLEQRGLAEDRVALAEEELTKAREAVALAEQQLGLAQRTGTEAQRRQAQAGLNDARAAELAAQRSLGEAQEQEALDTTQRRIALRESERDLQREINGLAGDGVAEARDALASAQEEVSLARQRLTLADTEAEQEEARADLNEAMTAELQAQRSLRQAQIEQQREQYDLDEARARAMLALRGQGDDAVAGARLDLAITQRNLRDINARLAEGNLTRRERTQLETEQQRLVAQQAEQQRQLNDALEARAELMRGLRDAEQGLRDASGEQLRGVALATRDLTRARQDLTREEREYARALQSNDPAKIKEATEQLTGAIQKHRDAMRGLAAEYRKTIGDMDGVRDAAARLGQALYGEDGPEYDSQREADRLAAIMARRNEALKRFQEAVASGNQEAIAAALADLAAQQERLQEQADKMEENGQSVTDRSRRDVESAFNVADRLGISADRMAGPLERQAAAIDKEADAIQAFGGHVDRFANALVTFGQVEPAELVPSRALAADAPLTDLSSLSDLLKDTGPLNTTLRQLQQVLTPPSTPLAAAIPTAQPAPQMTYTDNSQQTIQIYQQPGESAEALWARIKPVISRDFGLDRAFNGPCGNR